eukprot:CAMPEP_0170879460 /NCGR_PEP_ID=MMETSP0734-20130129/31744_1 /TAXON_ID=186038 /ORGANISM="Fragilariopsis kerguelensis, Strain L26-C5" /LENGTH=31 /DNA_ID= /DNA_START= /DNA_END= /DNA_ORIENTATION=
MTDNGEANGGNGGGGGGLLNELRDLGEKFKV